MRAIAVSALLSFTLLACSSKKDAPSTGSAEPRGSSSAEPPKGSAEPPKGSASEPPKAGSGSDAGSATGSGSAGSGSSADAGSGSGSGSSADAGSGSGAGAGSGSAKWEFDKLTQDEKMDFMKKQVVPTMKPLFQKFDAKEFANFGCKTCHGKDPRASKYKMPSPDVPALDFAALKAGKQKPEVAKWMSEVVKPEMAKLLQEPEMTESNPKGFGCLGCHETKK